MGGKAAIFSAETFRFFRELGRNNRKAWMDSNRERYRAHVVEPLRALLDALAPLAQQLNPDFDTSGRTGRNFSRINRDVRFAADKSPYRTQMYLTFSDQRSPDGDDGQLYVGVSPDAITSGFRIYSQGRGSRLAQVALPRDGKRRLARAAGPAPGEEIPELLVFGPEGRMEQARWLAHQA
jgi:uncharacterized protein (TIGR02453 family)